MSQLKVLGADSYGPLSHRHMKMLRCCASLSTVMFPFRSYTGAKSHDSTKAKEYQMQWNLFVC